MSGRAVRSGTVGALFLAAVLVACFSAGAADVPRQGAFQHQVVPGDRLRITVTEQADLSRVYPVAGDGTIDFGFIGRINVADMTVSEAADRIEKLLEESYFKEATVSIEVAEFVEGAILITGEVAKPGSILMKSDEILTLTEAITMCGGLTRKASGKDIRILRWKPGGGMERQILTVDIQSMFEKLDFSQDQYLRPRDMIVVPSLGEGEGAGEVLVLGDVGSAGFYPYVEGMDIIRTITRAGGVSRFAKWNAARLLRRDKTGNYTVILIDLSLLFGAADMSVNIKVQPGDIIFVPSSEQASRGQVYLLGQVAKSGAVPLDPDATLAKTILNTGGFGKFANENKVKILRTAPDGSKQSLVVDVGNILKTGSFENDVPLENGDVVIVPEKVLGF